MLKEATARAAVAKAFEAVRLAFQPARNSFPLPGKTFSEAVVPAVAASLPSIEAFAATLRETTVGCHLGEDGGWPEQIRSELAACSVLVERFSGSQKSDLKDIYEAGARVYNSCVDARDFCCDPAGVAGS